MKRLFTKEQLNSYLKDMDRNQLEDMIYDLYTDSSLVAKKLEMQFISDKIAKSFLHEYKKNVRKLFFPSISSFQADTFKVAKLLKEFEKICPDLEEQGELMVEILDCELEILSYGYSSQAFMDSFTSILDELTTVAKKLAGLDTGQILDEKISGIIEASLQCEQPVQDLVKYYLPGLPASKTSIDKEAS